MRLLVLFAAAVCACAQTLPPLVDAQYTIDWIGRTLLDSVQIDGAGDVYFAGIISMGDAPVPATYTIGPGGDHDIVVFKMDARLQQLKYVTVIGGSGFDSFTGMQVDREGHVYVSGTSRSVEFPATKRLPGTLEKYGGFVLRLSTAGDKIDYGLLMPMESRVLSLGLDGGLYIGGDADDGEVPITPNAYMREPGPHEYPYVHGYVMKLRAADGEIEFATWVPQHILNSMTARRDGGVAFTAESSLVALNRAGTQADFTVPLESSTNLLAADPAGNLHVYETSQTINRIRRYSAQGALVQTIDLGRGVRADAFAVSEDGTAYLTGAAAASLPTQNSLETCFTNLPLSQPPKDAGRGLVMVSLRGTVSYSGFTTVDFRAMAVSLDGRYLYAPSSPVIARLDMQQIPTTAHFSPSCLANGASYNLGRVAPGGLMTIYGSGIGPQTGVSFALVNGRVPNELAGVSVTVDGVPAPILYAQDAQINFIVPWSTRPFGTMPICVTRGSDRACLESWATPVDPAIFGDSLGPIVVLPDGTRTTRVPSGGYFTVYLTGTGLMNGPIEDGGVSGFPLRHVVAPGVVTVRDGTPFCPPPGACRTHPNAVITYAGNSPGTVWGLTQVNVRLPDLNDGSYRVSLFFLSSVAPPELILDVYRP
jgi:uncharacterized protein (TIGR03437 family)